jgi:FlaG/FlaF family flagellin (archaellin)
LTSGERSGTVQVVAETKGSNDRIIRSQPVLVTITGGLPNENHFEVSSVQKNIPANSNTPNEITVLLGDQHGNPVTPGTAVYFSTSKGNIDGSANTDEQGYASSLLRTNNTSPGIATVRIETVDESSEKISREIDVLFSGRPSISISPQNIDLLGFESQVFEVILSDEVGNPLSEGTTMDVTIDHPDLILTGSTSVELGDEIEPGNGTTHFEFRLRNPDRVAIEDEINLIISTAGPNGQTSKTLTFEPEKALIGEPGSIYVESVSETSIGVRATGQKEDTQITFQVVDINGNPLNNESAVDVDFKFGNRPNGGEFLSKSKERTNNLGQVTVTLTSGERSGTVQVVAETKDSKDRIIRSQPVGVTINAGLPSEQYFSLLPSQRNMTYSNFGQEYEVTAIVGDKYSNTVPDGVAIFFESNGGSIDGAATTVDGNASTILKMGHPVPSNGLAQIRAYTANDNQNTISTSTNVIFSGSPRINVNPSTFNLGDGEDQTFTIIVRDSNEYPMVEGTTINVTLEGDGLSIIGNTSFTLRDVNSDLSNIDELTRFIINVRDADPGNVTDDPVIMTIEVEGPNGYARHTIEGRKAKTM